ncbi:hypothetical protein [Oceanobacillus senegalensis]|uniref:hypothetical protein n=1 Tax=Oceanobacillus senegalensis TaxID=1936063 RepID=UPI000A30C5C8|nr:hypothetical protein [Oceanobacillus senegalensis]
MKKIKNWLFEPYHLGKSDIRYLKGIQSEAQEKTKKLRVFQLILFNIMILAIYSFLFAMCIVYIAISFSMVYWFAFVGVFFVIPIMMLIKYMQKKVYMKFRDAYIEKDPSLF